MLSLATKIQVSMVNSVTHGLDDTEWFEHVDPYFTPFCKNCSLASLAVHACVSRRAGTSVPLYPVHTRALVLTRVDGALVDLCIE